MCLLGERMALTVDFSSIIERASTRQSLGSSILQSCIQFLSRPHRFLASKPCLLVSTLYFGTYLTANTIDTITSVIHHEGPDITTSGSAKFLATSSVNLSLCLYKDSQFTRIFANPTTPAATVSRAVPMASYALFAVRDSMTVFASFNLPPLIAPLSKHVEEHVSKTNVAQFIAPAGIQLISTPLHLWGLDLYNRPAEHGLNWKERASRVGRDWLGSSLARMARIIPAFGVGGVVNARVRKNMMGLCMRPLRCI